jgi:exopolysaccharide biosynthesis polyprenyl glycosylphosphotransferase
MAPSPAALAAEHPIAAARRVPIRSHAHAHSPQRHDAFAGRRWTLLTAISDAVVLWAGAAAATRPGGLASATGAVVGAMAAAMMLRLASRGLYRTGLTSPPLLDATRETIAAGVIAVVCGLAATAALGLPRSSVATVLEFGALASGMLIAVHTALTVSRQRAHGRGRSGRRTLIVGAGLVGTQLEQRMLAKRQLGLVPVGFLDSDPPPARRVGGRRGPVLGAPDDLAAAVRLTGAQQVIIAFSNAPDSKVLPLIRGCERLGLDVAVVPRLFENVDERLHVEHVGGMPLCGLRRVDPKSWEFAVKHVLDRAMAGALLVLAAPLLGALAMAVRLSSPGPVFFRQRRVGRDGQVFDILKFRSMRIEPARVSVAFTSAVTSAETAPGGVEDQDRRTRVGALLRRTSLDELPQLINVVRGQMSLVGPRPERPEFVAMFGERVRRYGERHRVKSGMTGWAQVHGLRGQTSLSERVEWDNWYIQNWSLWLDLKILLMTPLAVLRAPGEEHAPGRELIIETDDAPMPADDRAAPWRRDEPVPVAA